ncbi:MAG: hypothetical protein CR972_05270 [Candidatus Moraniibacteriota bacterium]|nr:MAG: hypothetical protein CR972_05270 [Candidatus Moranbacteria bacterium]
MQNTSIIQTQYRTFRQKPVVFLMCVAKEKMWFGIGTVMCVIIGSSISIFIPVMIGKLVDLFSIDASLQQIYIALTFLCVLFFLKDVLARLSGGVFASTWIIHMEFCAAVIPFTYLLQHSAKFFANRMSGVLQNNVFNISRAVGSIARIALWEFLYVMMKIAMTVFIACTLHMLVGGIFAMCIGIFILYNLFIAPKITAYSYKWTKQLSHTKGLLVDTITNILAIKQHAMETEEERVITENLSTWKNIRMKGWRFFAMTTFIGNIILLTMFVTTAFFLISLWNKEVITAGQIVALMAILVNLSGTLEFLNKSFNRFMEDYGQLKEGLEQIFVPIDITDAKDAQSVTITKGEIQCRLCLSR